MIKYRLARKQDIPKLVEFILKHVATHPFSEVSNQDFTSEKDYLKFLDRMLSVQLRLKIMKGTVFLGLEANQIVATAFGRPNSAEFNIIDYALSGSIKLFPYFRNGCLNKIISHSQVVHERSRELAGAKSWLLNCLVVSKDYRASAVGTTLLESCIIPKLLHLGIKSVVVNLQDDATVNFFESCGFNPVDETQTVINNHKFVNSYMVKPLVKS